MKRFFNVVFFVFAAGILADPAGSSANGQNSQVITQFTAKNSLLYTVKLNDSTKWFTNGIIATTVIKSGTGKIEHINLCEPFRRNKSYLSLDPMGNRFVEHKMDMLLKYQTNYFSLSKINADTTAKQGIPSLDSIPASIPATK